MKKISEKKLSTVKGGDSNTSNQSAYVSTGNPLKCIFSFFRNC